MGDVQLVEYARDHEVDDVGDGLRMRVEARRGRKDHRAGMREPRHVVEVDHRQRRLARHQHERTPLLEHDVGGALDQVVGEPVRDRAERAHAAGTHGHRVGGIVPDATGAIQSSRAKTWIWSSAAA